jgi:hypothetical protein
MLINRCVSGLYALLGAMLPLLVCWFTINAVIAHREATSDPNAPNPSNLPIAPTLGPFDVLVYADPWLAGRILLWAIPATVILTGLVGWAMGLPVLNKGTGLGPPHPTGLRLLLISMGVGLFAELPWVYAVGCVLLH